MEKIARACSRLVDVFKHVFYASSNLGWSTIWLSYCSNGLKHCKTNQKIKIPKKSLESFNLPQMWRRLNTAITWILTWTTCPPLRRPYKWDSAWPGQLTGWHGQLCPVIILDVEAVGSILLPQRSVSKVWQRQTFVEAVCEINSWRCVVKFKVPKARLMRCTSFPFMDSIALSLPWKRSAQESLRAEPPPRQIEKRRKLIKKRFSRDLANLSHCWCLLGFSWFPMEMILLKLSAKEELGESLDRFRWLTMSFVVSVSSASSEKYGPTDDMKSWEPMRADEWKTLMVGHDVSWKLRIIILLTNSIESSPRSGLSRLRWNVSAANGIVRRWDRVTFLVTSVVIVQVSWYPILSNIGVPTWLVV